MTIIFEQDYFHEVGNSPDIVLPLLSPGNTVRPQQASGIERLLFDSEENQVVAGITSYTLTRDNPEDPGGYLVWAGARKEDDAIHPNVFSMPTSRIPARFIGALLAEKVVAISEGQSLHFKQNWRPLLRKDDPVVDRVDHVLTGKLNGRFEYDRSGASASLASIRYGLSRVFGVLKQGEQPRDLEEAILMLDIIVHLDNDIAGVYPGEPLEEYPVAQWVDPKSLLEAWNTKDISELIPEDSNTSEADLCIHGVCIVSSVEDYRLGILDAHMDALRQTSG